MINENFHSALINSHSSYGSLPFGGLYKPAPTLRLTISSEIRAAQEQQGIKSNLNDATFHSVLDENEKFLKMLCNKNHESFNKRRLKTI